MSQHEHLLTIAQYLTAWPCLQDVTDGNLNSARKEVVQLLEPLRYYYEDIVCTYSDAHDQLMALSNCVEELAILLHWSDVSCDYSTNTSVCSDDLSEYNKSESEPLSYLNFIQKTPLGAGPHWHLVSWFVDALNDIIWSINFLMVQVGHEPTGIPQVQTIGKAIEEMTENIARLVKLGTSMVHGQVHSRSVQLRMSCIILALQIKLDPVDTTRDSSSPLYGSGSDAVSGRNTVTAANIDGPLVDIFEEQASSYPASESPLKADTQDEATDRDEPYIVLSAETYAQLSELMIDFDEYPAIHEGSKSDVAVV